MSPLSRDALTTLLKAHRISQRLQRTLRFVPEEISDWDARDFLAVMNKARTEGVFIVDDAVIPFELSLRTAGVSGRTAAVICDICATWQRGSNSARITFRKGAKATVSYLVCADLACSLHVRDRTSAAKVSRTQLRESIGMQGRVERLRRRLDAIISSVTSV